jgi:WD40 repeat protein
VYKTGFSVFYENESIRKDERFVHFPNKVGVRITCAALSPNGDDLALGYKDGTINVFTSILSLSSAYILDKENGDVTQKLIHPREKVLKRKMHWHSLPVKTLCYMGVPGSRAAPSLLSGAEEAVLVTWNTERGLNRPTHTLPRIAKGCLTHISSYDSSSSMGDTGSMDIIVRSMDNTLQLIHGHNYAVKWKIQGIASAMNECVAPSTPQSEVPSKDTSVILRIDPKTQTPIMTRLSGAPGFLHWYDPHHEQVIGELEAAPFNRISRKSPGDEAYPRPTITHFAVSQSGNDFITVDTTLSENLSVGSVCDVGSSKKMSQSTNIKFWSYSKALEEENSKLPYGKGMAYELIAAMPSPHGLSKGGIDALAISPDGTKACSLSHEEGAFHIWKKSKSTLTSNSPVSPLWKRYCKISVPSGYANSLTGTIGCSVQSSMSFSNDGSVLVIAFGDTITLWDHSSAALINTFHAGDSLRDVQFVRYPLDMVLATGASSVSILSPFGDGYLGGMAWSYKVPQGDLVRGEKIELDSVTSIPSKKELAVVMKRIEPANGKEKKSPQLSSRIILIDIMTGKPKLREDKTQYYWDVEGKIESLCDISQIRSEWSNENAVLLALTDKHELLVLSTDEANGNQAVLKPMKHHFFSKTENASTPALVSDKAPRLESRKKRRTDNAIKNESESNEEEEAIGSYLFDGRSDNALLPTSQLPFLTGSITAAFVGRNLRKRAKANHQY